MQIYQAEIDAGLAEQITNSKISIACEMFTKDGFKPQASREKLIQAIAKANPDQRDLFYKHSILASVGWNANDDVFDRIETWNARNTPVDKQINFMHNELDIIGHSTQSSVYDVNGNLIPDDTPIEKLPLQFDVVTEFVLYQMWDSDARRELMEKLISEIAEDKWYVSMECRFPSFDYAIIEKDGKTHRTVARTQDTAFLTKHLKAFGGTGEYEGRRVGRLIKNFFFSGQGIVDKPANPRSIIFNRAIAFNSQGSLIIKGKAKMEEELKKQVAKLQEQLEAVNKQQFEQTIASLQKELSEIKASNEAAIKAAKDKEKEDKEKEDKAMCALKEKDTAIANLTEELKSVNDKLSAAQAELDAGKKEKAQAERISKLVAAGLTSDEAKAEATKWECLDDARFADMVTIHQTKAEAVKAAKASKPADTTVTPKLDEAVVEANANLNNATASVADNVDAERKTIEEFFGGAMKFYGHAKAAAKKN